MADESGEADLNILDLGSIMQALAANRRSGTLRVDCGAAGVHSLYFYNGAVRLISHSPGYASIVEEALIKSRRIAPARLVEAKAQSVETGQPLAELFITQETFSRGELQRIVLWQICEQVTDLLACREARCEFFADRVMGERLEAELADFSPGIVVDGLLLEAARRADEWARIRHSFDPLRDVFETVTRNRSRLQGEVQPQLAALIDGYRDAGEIVEASGMSAFECCRYLLEMLAGEHIRIKNTPELAQLGDLAAARADWPKAVKLLQRARELNPGRDDLLVKLAVAYEALSQVAAATECLQSFAAINMEQGHFGEAARACQRLVELDPENPEPRATLFKALLAEGDRDGLAAVGKDLVHLYEKRAEMGRAVDVLRNLREFFPDDSEIAELDARARLANAERTEALVQYEQLADSYVQRGDLEGAVRTFRKILEEIDEECLEARLQMAECLIKLDRTEEAAAQYRKLAEVLARTGLMGASANLPFFMKVHLRIAELDPTNASSREWLAETLAARQDRPGALAHFAQLFAIHEETGDGKKLIAALRRAVELYPDEFECRERLAGLYLAEEGDRAKAREELVALCRTAEERKNYVVGERAARRLLELDPFHMDSHLLLARSLRADGDAGGSARKFLACGLMFLGAGLLDRATEALGAAVELEGQDADLQFFLAGALDERGDGAEAAAHYKAAGQLFAAQRDFGRARDCLKRALEISPSDGEAQDLLGRLN